MGELFHSANIWKPVILRGGLWIAAAMIGAAKTGLLEMRHDGITKFGLVLLIVDVIYQGVLTWRVYLDQSFTKHAEKVESETQQFRKP